MIGSRLFAQPMSAELYAGVKLNALFRVHSQKVFERNGPSPKMIFLALFLAVQIVAADPRDSYYTDDVQDYDQLAEDSWMDPHSYGFNIITVISFF